MHRLLCVTIVHSFLLVRSSSFYKSTSLFIHSFSKGYLDFIVINVTSINIMYKYCVNVSFHLYGKYLGMISQILTVNAYLTLKENAKLFSMVTLSHGILTNNVWLSNCCSSSPANGIVRALLSLLFHSSWYLVISHDILIF